MLYLAIKLAFSLAVRLGFFKLTVIGKENIPVSGGAILAANHYGPFDPPFICLLSRRIVKFMFRRKGRVYSFWRKMMGAFPVNKGKPDRKSLGTAERHLERGELVGMMVIGHRQKYESNPLPQRGACYLAFKCKVRTAVVPIGIFWSSKKKPISVYIGCGSPLYRGSYHDSYEMNEALGASIAQQREIAEQLARNGVL